MNSIKNIQFVNEIVSKDSGSKADTSSLDKKKNDTSKTIKKKNSFIYKLLIITLISSLVIAGSIAVYFLVLRKPPALQVSPSPPTTPITPTCLDTCTPFETNVNDLKRIYINQKYYQDIKTDGILTKNLLDRKTNYDIFVIEEIPASEEAKYYYNKTFLCSIAISSECLNGRDEYCIPQKKVDLIEQDPSRVRNLEQKNDLENFPIPLCFFNLTDNNVITSISCHKYLSEEKINSIVLDLYFFRPSGILRLDKESRNITIQLIKMVKMTLLEK
jgi:hypothetical protein